jgi:glycosyltransferase involved in cell wall biosynthesis
MGMGARVVVTLPAFMAEQTLAQTVQEIPAELDAEVIVVDDASRDRTAEVARELGMTLFLHERNKGYGANQKTCYDEALKMGAEVVVLLHADYQYDPKSIVRLVEPILAGRADFTFGSRFAKGADPRLGGMPLYRYWGNKFTTSIENLFLGTRFSELHSGFKAYHRSVLERLNYHAYSDDFVFDSQMLIDAVLNRIPIEEVPIPTRYTLESSSISVKRSLVYIGMTIYELFRARLKRRTPALRS